MTKSFQTSKQKIKILRQKEVTNSVKKDRQEIISSNIEENTKQKSTQITTFKVPKILNNAWVLMDVYVDKYGTLDINKQYKTFEYNLGEIDYRILPHINVETIIRTAGAETEDDGVIVSFLKYQKSTYFEIEDIQEEKTFFNKYDEPKNEFLRKVTLYTTIYLNDVNIKSQYEAQLLLQIINPRQF